MPRLRLLPFLTIAILATAASARAATINVTTTADDTVATDGLCSLRKAIEAVDAPVAAGNGCAAAAFGANTIVLPAGTYTLSPSNGELAVSATVNDLTIDGIGVGATTLSGNGATRVLSIAAGASVLIENMTITRGQAPAGAGGASAGGAGGDGASGAGGGAILNAGNLTLTGVAITASAAGAGGAGGSGGGGHSGGAGGPGGAGGALLNTGSALLSGVTIAADAAGAGGSGGLGGAGGPAGGAGGPGGGGGNGGGVENAGGGSVTITGSTFQADAAGAGGAGAGGGKGSTTAGRGGDGGHGGYGAAINTNGIALSITNSTFAGSNAGAGGNGGAGGAGGTAGAGGAGAAGGSGGSGGALAAPSSATITLSNATLAGNSAGAGGAGGPGGPGKSVGAGGAGGATGGGALFYSGSHLTLTSTLLASNAGGNCDAPSLVNAGHNLSFGDLSCPAAFLNGNPQLGPLQDNGGPTETIDLGAGSAAISANPPGVACPATDQRGVPRPAGGACDIGAYQVTAPLASTGPVLALSSRSATVSGAVTPYAGQGAVSVQYGTSTAYGLTSAAVNVGGVSSAPVSIALGGLRPRTRYHYRLLISTTDGTAVGGDMSFATTVPVLSAFVLIPAAPTSGHRVTLTYRDSERSVTSFTLLRCLQRVNRRSTRCKRYGSVLTFTHHDRAGPNLVGFNARLHGKSLPSGLYVLQAAPRAGIASGGTAAIRFALGR